MELFEETCFRWLLVASLVVLVVKNPPPANAGDIIDKGSIPHQGRSPGEGNGNPLQYSCLENPMDRGTWRGTFHGVVKSWTRLKRLIMHVNDVFASVWAVYNFELPGKTRKDYGCRRHATVLGIKIPRICTTLGQRETVRLWRGEERRWYHQYKLLREKVGEREGKREMLVTVQFYCAAFPFIMLLWNVAFISSKPCGLSPGIGMFKLSTNAKPGKFCIPGRILF